MAKKVTFTEILKYAGYAFQAIPVIIDILNIVKLIKNKQTPDEATIADLCADIINFVKSIGGLELTEAQEKEIADGIAGMVAAVIDMVK